MMARSIEDPNEEHEHGDSDQHALPEAEALLSLQHPPPFDGVPNAETAAVSSSPLLVRTDNDNDPSTRPDKLKHKKPKKSRKASASGDLRAPRPRSKKRDSKDGSTNRSGQARGDLKSGDVPSQTQDQSYTQRAPRPTSSCCSVWSLFSHCICVKGSLLPPVSVTELSPLSAQAEMRLKSLDKISRKCQVEVSVRHTDSMSLSTNSITSYGHPIVVINVVDVLTGLSLATHQHTRPAIFSPRMLNAFEWNSAHIWPKLTLTEFFSPQVVVLLEIIEPRQRRLPRRPPSSAPKRQDLSSTRRTTANSKDILYDLKSERFYRRIAWCFFKPINARGNIRLPLSMLDDASERDDTTLRLQLYAWLPLSWLDAHQARSQYQWIPESGDGVPTVFLQYQRRTRTQLPCTLHVEIRPVAARSPPTQSESIPDGVSDTTAKGIQGPTDSNQNGTINQPIVQPSAESVAEAAYSAPGPLLLCKRNIGEPCLVPRRVLHRLPTGRRGCSCLAFSPDGLFIAAGVHHATSTADEWVIQIHEINTGELWQSCRGHQGMVYAVEWGLRVDGSTKALLSASSDGAAIQWGLIVRGTSNSLARSNAPDVLPSRIFQHVPSPVFVYCAIFHTTQSQLIVTGASDGAVRLWDASPSTISNRTCMSSPVLEWKIVGGQGQSIAVHSIRMEAKHNGRLFCGDSSGTITVWVPAMSSAGTPSYELSKTVRTGQRSIASLALHPRKQHLVVLTHPHALFQYETRSFLLLHKNYSGIECDQLLAKAAFSPDGQFLVSGSEDGVPHLFRAVEGVRLDGSSGGGLWGHRFFHGFPLLEIAWSPTSHVVAMGAYGANHPIVVLCANRGDDMTHISPTRDEKLLPDRPQSRTAQLQKSNRQSRDKIFVGLDTTHGLRAVRNPVVPAVDVHDLDGRDERALQRRQQRLETKLARELEDAQPRT